MMHVSLHWAYRGVDSFSLWSSSVGHSVCLHNRVPNQQSGLTPIELLTKKKADHWYLLWSSVWGCPVYVFDPKSQYDWYTPRWN